VNMPVAKSKVFNRKCVSSRRYGVTKQIAGCGVVKRSRRTHKTLSIVLVMWYRYAHTSVQVFHELLVKGGF